MPRVKKTTRPASLNLTEPKPKKGKVKKLPPPPPTPDEETLPSSFQEDAEEEEWDDVDSLEPQGSETAEEEWEDGGTPVSSPMPAEPIRPPPLPSKKTKQRRWDQKPADVAAGKPDEVGLKNKSWRPFKHLITTVLLTSCHDVPFTRRFLLYRHGINVPKNVIRYYNSHCRAQSPEEAWEEINPVSQYIRRVSGHSGAESQDISNPIRDIPAESGKEPKPENKK